MIPFENEIYSWVLEDSVTLNKQLLLNNKNTVLLCFL